MTNLTEVQTEVNRQLGRDYGYYTKERVRNLCVYGLTEEAGEVAGLMKRLLRNNDRDKEAFTHERFVDELGDVLWYLAACCETLDTSLEDIWEHNKKKLEDRYGR